MPDVGEGQNMNDSFTRIGKQLQVARKERGLRTADVARELRISADYLRLLEAGDFGQLPAPTYVSGFLRSYGRFLGLDGADLAGRFYALNGDASSTMDYKLPVTAGPPQRSAPAVASLFVVLTLIGYGGWYWVSGPSTSDATAESELAVVEIDNKKPGLMEKNAIGQRLETASQTSIDAKDDSAEKMSTVTNAATNAGTGARGSIVNDGDNAVGTTILGSAVLDSDAPAIPSANLENGAPDITTSTSSPSFMIGNDAATESVTNEPRREDIKDLAVAADPVQRLVPGSAAALATLRNPDDEVTIRATASSWVEDVRGDGTTVLKKLMRAGDIYIVDDSSGLYLSTGNAGGIEILSGENEIITIGSIGEIVRDLPLAKNRLRDRF